MTWTVTEQDGVFFVKSTSFTVREQAEGVAAALNRLGVPC